MRRELAALAVPDGCPQRLERIGAGDPGLGEEVGGLRGGRRTARGGRRRRRPRARRHGARGRWIADHPELGLVVDMRAERGQQRREFILSGSVAQCTLDGQMSLLGLVVLLLLCWPGEAHAWGPVTHLVHGSQILENLSSLAPALQEILGRSRLPYLYGWVAADIMHAKKYTRSLYTHCHCWPVGWQIVESARTEREEAFAWGYLSHLAADVHSHNHFVPVQL